MQLTSVPAPTTPTAPARDVIRPRMPEDVRSLVPDTALNTRIGKGTVASEFDRTISVRIEGDGPPSTRTIVPQTRTAEKVLSSKAGPAFERMVRRTMAVGDAATGQENLRSLTLAPDEHAVKAYEFLELVTRAARKFGQQPRFSDEGTPEAEKRAAQSLARDVAKSSAQDNANTLAWNGDGAILVMPDVSRRLLASIGAYKLRDGDRILQAPKATREEVMRDDWDTLLHEAHHSVTPTKTRDQIIGMWEEAIPSILGKQDRSIAARQAGADINAIVERPRRGSDAANLGWSGWNRSKLPQPNQAQRERSRTTYRNGPEIVRNVLKMVGIDRRTTEGRNASYALLQGVPAEHVPHSIARALVSHHNLPLTSLDAITAAVTQSINDKDGAKVVERAIAKAGAKPR